MEFLGQTSLLDLKKYPKCISAGGGFGPVADDGYGVSYIIVGEDTVFFHVSSKKSCPITVSINYNQYPQPSSSDNITIRWLRVARTLRNLMRVRYMVLRGLSRYLIFGPNEVLRGRCDSLILGHLVTLKMQVIKKRTCSKHS